MRFSSKSKLHILNQVLREGESVSKVCRQAGIARKTFYQWKERYLQASAKNKKKSLESKYVFGKNHPKSKRYKFKKAVISIVTLHPEWGGRKISTVLSRGKSKISSHAIYNLLKEFNLETVEKRVEFSNLHQAFSKVRKIYQAKPLRLTPEARREMIERVVLSGEAIAHVCQDFQVSKKTFYKWLSRYKEAETGNKQARAQVFEDRYQEGFQHPRAISPELEEKILEIVRENPYYSTHKISAIISQISNHGVESLFKRFNLNTYQKRLAYSQVYQPEVVSAPAPEEALARVVEAPLPFPQKAKSLVSSFLASLILSTLASLASYSWIVAMGQAPTLGTKLGLIFATVALAVGGFFFAYSMKYYFSLALVLSFSRRSLDEEGAFNLNGDGDFGNGKSWFSKIFGLANGNGRKENGNGVKPAGGLQPSLEHIHLKRYPFVSIHLPMYNEKKVAKRLLEASTSMDYPNYEIIVCDDSTDETTQIVENFAKDHNANLKKQGLEGPYIKILHRPTRKGFKGAALGYALKKMNPKTEFVVVFDADFVPYPDTLELFVKNFKANNPAPEGSEEQYSEDYTRNNIAVVGGYQWHVLNKSENWITRGVRTEYSGSYVIERPGREILGLLKQISGSVYMIRADVIKKVGWGTSITEDFQLTLKLYEKGYKVVYTPYVQAPAECVSTLKRLIRQRMRWAEGHSNNMKKMLFRLLRSPYMNLREKLEAIYLTPYYLQAFFFLLGTFSWLLSEAVFRSRLPFWTELWGWSLVLTNLFALPLMNAIGLFLEESEEKDYLGLLSFVALSYIVVPFQAYASLKGFLEKEEGGWFRTPKSGKITDVFKRGTFYRLISGILPRRTPTPAPVAAAVPAYASISDNPYVQRMTANSQFNGFRIRRKRMRWVGKIALVALLIFSLTIYTLSVNVSEVMASTVNNFYLADSVTDEDTTDVSLSYNVGKWQKQGAAVGGTDTNFTPVPTFTQWWYSREYPTDTGDASVVAGTYYFNFYVSDNGKGTADGFIYTVETGYCDGGCNEAADYHVIATSATITYPKNVALGLHHETIGARSALTFTASNKARMYTKMVVSTVNSVAMGYNGSAANYISNLETPTLTVPENVFLFLASAPLIPMIALWIKKKREGLALNS